MTFAGAINPVTMTGTLIDDQGTPLAGTVTLTPSVRQVVVPSVNMIIQLETHRLVLDEDGHFAVDMIPTSDPDVIPVGVTWTLTHNSPDETTTNSLTFVIPTDAVTADIAQYVVSGQNDAGTPQYLVGYRGPSAYDVAVQNGYIGTVNEWLAGLGTGGGSGTGTVLASSVSGLPEAVQDIVAAMMVAGSNVSWYYNDTAGTLTLNAAGSASTGGSGSAGSGTGTTDPEVVRDTIAAALVAGANVAIASSDASDTITISVTGLSTVATSGSYNDLSGKPTIPAAVDLTKLEAVVFYANSAWPSRPSGYARVRWVGGTARPTAMVTGDIWEHDA